MKLYVVMPVINCLDLTKGAIESIQTKCTIILIDNGSTDATPRWGEMMHKQELTYEKRIFYIRNNEPKSVAASWNQGIKMAFEDPECEYVAVINNDVVLHPKTLPNLMAFIDKTGYLMVTGDNIKDRMSIQTMLQMELPMQFTEFDCAKIEDWRAEGPDFSCYLINRETIRVIGWFDENYIGAYCEDQDYHARCAMIRSHIEEHNDQGIPVDRVHFKRLSTAPYYHYASQTLVRNVELRHDVTMKHGKNQEYYIKKFGGDHPSVMDGVAFKQPFADASKSWRKW